MSLEFLRSIRAMAPDRLMTRWGSSMPWRHMGKQVRLPMPQPILRKHVHLSGPGHITQLRVRVLRPCFGSPTAFLRHGGVRLIARREKPPFKSRCTYCHAREGCEKVAVYRLYNNSEVRC